ncbi:MAG: hypothetical protein P8Z30_02155 [Acidobacteriota bacterium]
MRRVFRKVFSFPVFLVALLLAGAFAGTVTNIHQVLYSTQAPLRWVESDTLWHVVVGNMILKTHTWPTHDIFSFTAQGTPWIAYEWLGEVVMALAWRAGGLHGLMILLTILIWTILLALFYYAYLGSKEVKSAFVTSAVLIPLAAVSWSLRPQLLGYIFVIVTLIVLKRFREGSSRSLWILPFVFLLWVNSHGTFILGFGALGIYWLSGLKEFRFGSIYAQRWTQRQRQQLELTALLCLLASIITPYGTQLVAYPLEMAVSQPMVLRFIQEWQPLSMSDFSGKLFLVLVLSYWILVATRRLNIRLEDGALLLIAIAETFMHARFMVLFVPVFAPMLAEQIAPWFPPYSEEKDHPVLNFALIGLICLGIVRFLPSRTMLRQQLTLRMPVAGVRYLDAHPGLGPTFNSFFWGGYLILDRGPAHKVFIDGRLDIYEYSGVMADYLAITGIQPDYAFLLRKYHVRSCLIHRDSPLATVLLNSPEWKDVYQDKMSIILTKTGKNAVASAGHAQHGG